MRCTRGSWLGYVAAIRVRMVLNREWFSWRAAAASGRHEIKRGVKWLMHEIWKRGAPSDAYKMCSKGVIHLLFKARRRVSPEIISNYKRRSDWFIPRFSSHKRWRRYDPEVKGRSKRQQQMDPVGLPVLVQLWHSGSRSSYDELSTLPREESWGSCHLLHFSSSPLLPAANLSIISRLFFLEFLSTQPDTSHHPPFRVRCSISLFFLQK